jgi:serine/threonine protein kinase
VRHLDDCPPCRWVVSEAGLESRPIEGVLERLRPGVLQTGTVLARRYRIRRLLGMGAMGEVHEADDTLLKKTIAIKTLNARLSGDKAAIERLKSEVATAHRVTHENVCRIFDLNLDADDSRGEPLVFITMEYLPGITLAAHLRKRGRLPAPEAFVLFRQLAQGLAAAHAAGVVHRDLKPENVMLVEVPERSTRGVITDFGLAGTSWGESVAAGSPGSLSGTPAYAAPERLIGQPATTASDVYSFGLMVYESLTGCRSASSLSDLGAFPVFWRRLVRAAVESDSSRRLMDGAALLSCFSRPSGQPIAPISGVSVRRFAIGAILLAGVAGGVARLAKERHETPREVPPTVSEPSFLGKPDLQASHFLPVPEPMSSRKVESPREPARRREARGRGSQNDLMLAAVSSQRKKEDIQAGLIREVPFSPDPRPSERDLVDPFTQTVGSARK